MEKNNEIVKNLDSAIAKIQNKEHKIIFMVPLKRKLMTFGRWKNMSFSMLMFKEEFH